MTRRSSSSNEKIYTTQFSLFFFFLSIHNCRYSTWKIILSSILLCAEDLLLFFFRSFCGNFSSSSLLRLPCLLILDCWLFKWFSKPLLLRPPFNAYCNHPTPWLLKPHHCIRHLRLPTYLFMQTNTA